MVSASDWKLNRFCQITKQFLSMWSGLFVCDGRKIGIATAGFSAMIFGSLRLAKVAGKENGLQFRVRVDVERP